MNKKFWYLILLVVLTIGIRLLYAQYRPQPVLSIDGMGYYSLGNEMLQNPTVSTIVNQYRTPLYPLFLSSVVALTGNRAVSVNTIEFSRSAEWVIFIQSICSVLAIVALYALLLRLSFPVLWAFGVSLLVGCNIFLFSWDRVISTDSFGISITLWLTYVVVSLIQTPSSRGYIFLFILSTVGWLLRPNIILIPIAAFVVLLLSKQQKKYLMINIIVFIATMSLPALYSQANMVYHGYKGITQAIPINLLGQILKYDLPIEAGRSHSYLYQSILDYRKHDGEPMPFRFFDIYDPTIYGNTAKINQLNDFVRAVIMDNIPSYITHAISYVPNLFSDVCSLVVVRVESGNILSRVFYSLQEFYRAVWHLGYLVFIFWPIVVITYGKKRSALYLIFIFLGAVIISELATVVFMVEDDATQEYARLAAIVQPLAYIFIAALCYNFLRSYDKHHRHHAGVQRGPHAKKDRQ